MLGGLEHLKCWKMVCVLHKRCFDFRARDPVLGLQDFVQREGMDMDM
jgi:hypothetical protein